jgi:hypothetical protein
MCGQTTLVHNAHPTIALLARQLLSREPLTSSPDLTLYTLTHFLDRFVYKNPKKVTARGTSAMQPFVAGCPDAVRRVRADVQEKPLNVEGWWRRGESGVAADQVCCDLHNLHAVALTLTIADVLPAILCAEARERAEEDSQS